MKTCSNMSLTCKGNKFAVEQVCCCERDYCNQNTPESDALYPKFSYHIDPPNELVPAVDKGISPMYFIFVLYD